MQKIDRVKLKNGLEIYFLIDKKFTTSSIQMMFKIGWRNDPVEQLGLAHLFEHLVGKRTKKYPDKSEFAKKLEVSGISHNAWTGPDTTVYLQEQTNENLLKSLELFYEAIYHSTFHVEDLEKEKEIVLTESRRYQDNDSSVVWREIIQNLFPDTTMGKFFFGNKETLSKITLPTFQEFYELYKNPTNSVLFIGTDKPTKKKAVVNLLTKLFQKDEQNSKKSLKKIERFVDTKKQVIPFKKISKTDKSQSEMRMAFRFDYKLSKKERVTFGVLRRILVGGLTGKLMRILRDDMGLIYGIDMTWDEHHQNIQYVEVETECAKDKREIVVSKIFEVLQNLEKYISDEDIKNTIPGCLYLAKKPVLVSRDLTELLGAITHTHDYLQTEEVIKILKKLKVQDLVKLAKKIFIKDMSTIVTME